MLGVGYGELAVIILVGLIVLGPKRLPKLMREFGKLLRTINRWRQEWWDSINWDDESDGLNG